MYAREWTNHESAFVKLKWEAGVDPAAISSELPGRTRDAVSRYANHHGFERPHWYKPPRPHENWDRIEALLKEVDRPLEALEIVESTGLTNSVVTKLLNDRRGKLVRVADYRITTRKPAAKWELGSAPDVPNPAKGAKRESANPFAGLMGIQPVVSNIPGRIYQQDMTGESLEDRRAA